MYPDRLIKSALVLLCAIFVLGLSACSSSSSDSGSVDSSVEATENNSPLADLPDGFLLLTTLEDSPVSGSLGLAGRPVAPDVNFDIITFPVNGTVASTIGSRLFVYTPDRDFFGSDSFDYQLANGEIATVTINVTGVNDAPNLFADIPRVAEQGTLYTSSLVVSDVDGSSHLFMANNLPAWLSLNADTGQISGTPSPVDLGVFRNIEFSAIDRAGSSSESVVLDIEVIALNDAPFINVDRFPSDMDAGEKIEVPFFPDDSNGDPVAIAFEPNALLDITIADGTLVVVAAEVDEVREVTLRLVATDSRGGVERSSVPLILHPINATGRGRTIHGRGAGGVGIHLVVLGDGYREDQQAQFRLHVEELIEKMQQDVGMSTHFAAWNVHMVETPSIDSGIDDNLAVDIRNTVFSTGYFCQSIARLICGDQTAMFGVAIEEYPNFDQILVLVNDSRFGGSGGNIAISSTESIEIALHEMGHSIAGLADEYVDELVPELTNSTFAEGQFANVTTNSDITQAPWQHWLNDNNAVVPGITNTDRAVGLFEGAFYQPNGFYRPTQDSLMRSFDGPLGPVNSEQWALSVYELARPVLNLSPVSRELSVSSADIIDFSVEPLFGSDLQAVEWRLDSRVIPDSGALTPGVSLSFPPGEYEVSVSVRDISGLIRAPEPHDGVFNWEWSVVSQ